MYVNIHVYVILYIFLLLLRKNVDLRCSFSGKRKKVRNDYGYHWEGDFFGFSTPFTPGTNLGDDLEYIPNAMKVYLEVAQKAIRRCLKELKNDLSSPRHKDDKYNSNNGLGTSITSPVQGANGTTDPNRILIRRLNGTGLNMGLYSTSPVKGKGTGLGSGVWSGLGPKIIVDQL
jgi:hypothetical protein